MSIPFKTLTLRTAAAGMLAAALLAAAVPHAPAAAQAPVPYASVQASAVQNAEAYRIVAFGDSLAAGYEFGMENQANPVPYGFVEHVYEQALFQGKRAEVRNYGILGLRTTGLEQFLAGVSGNQAVEVADVLAEGQAEIVDPRAGSILAAAADAHAALAEADLALVMIGGNDFKSIIDLDDPAAALSDMLPSYEQSLEASLRSMLEVNPKVRIVVGDQYLPVPSKQSSPLGLELAVYDQLMAAVDTLSARITALAERLTAEGYHVDAAYPSREFAGKEGSYTSVIVSRGKDIHPTSAGYAAMGRAFSDAIWGETRAVLPRAAGVPISVVVNGKEVVSKYKPIVGKDSRTYLVLRDIGDAMKADTRWDSKTQTAVVAVNGREVALTIGSKTMMVDGKPVAITTPAFLQESNGELKTFVPLSVLADGLGFQVVYRGALKTAFING
jgi:lysophospholipase L1-like esterase